MTVWLSERHRCSVSRETGALARRFWWRGFLIVRLGGRGLGEKVLVEGFPNSQIGGKGAWQEGFG